jgi:hypothetical protein
MRTLRRSVLVVVLLGCAGAWLWLRTLEQSYREEPYTLIEDGLYAGASVAEPPPGTKAVLNLCDRKDPYPVEATLWEPILDGKAPGIDWMRRMVRFVASQRQSGVTVYVHCNAGVSRSGLVVTAYVMEEHGWGRDRALAFVRSKRPQLQPNPAFLELLAGWERALKDPVSTEGK